MSILISGGAGYIGSHMVLAALDRGDEVVVLDNLSTGNRSLVAQGARFHHGDVGDQPLLRRLFEHYSITAVIHFAGSLIVPESVSKPLAYYANNTVASRNLIEACVQSGVKEFIFSSTAAVYGMPKHQSGDRNDGAYADQSLRPLQTDDRVDAGGCRAGA